MATEMRTHMNPNGTAVEVPFGDHISIAPYAFIHPTVEFVNISKLRIDEDVVISEGCTLYDNVELMKFVHIDVGATIEPYVKLWINVAIGRQTTVGAYAKVNSHSAVAPFVTLPKGTYVGQKTIVNQNPDGSLTFHHSG